METFKSRRLNVWPSSFWTDVLGSSQAPFELQSTRLIHYSCINVENNILKSFSFAVKNIISYKHVVVFLEFHLKDIYLHFLSSVRFF